MKSVCFFILLSLLLLQLVRAQVNPCNRSNCVACVALSACGFCGDTGECLPGNKNGPTNLQWSVFGRCPGRWQYAFASIIIQTSPGFPISPAEGDVYIFKDDNIAYPVNITRPPSDDVQIDLAVVQDSSGSMGPYMTLFAQSVPAVMSGILSNYRSSFFQSTSYCDKNILDSANLDRDYPFQFNSPGLELNPSAMQIASYKAIDSIGWGADIEEDPLDAIVLAVVCRRIMKWRENSRKFVFVATDAGYHRKGQIESAGTSDCKAHCQRGTSSSNQGQMVKQGFCVCNWRRSNYRDNCDSCRNGTFSYNLWDNECYTTNLAYSGFTPTSQATSNEFRQTCPFKARPWVPTCFPDPTNTMTLTSVPYTDRTWAMNYDYPSQEEVKNILLQYNTYPIIGSTRFGTAYTDNYYPDLVGNSRWGFGSYVSLNGDGNDIVNALTTSIETLAATMKLQGREPSYYMRSISPVNGYTGVPLLQRREFTVTFGSSNPDRNITQNFFSLGYPDISVRLWNKIPCIGCDGIPNSGKVVDRCGVCAPPVPDLCLGCDDIPNSGAIIDGCGVCKGNNSCYGCDAVKNSGKVLDQCGICGGDNSACRGCDLVICHYLNATCRPAVNDSCGKCNGNNDCYGCDGVFYPIGTPPKTDLCGVCNGNNACLDCNDVPYGGAYVDVCGKCGGNNTCLGCDGLIYPNTTVPPKPDICGVCNGDNSTCVGCDGRTDVLPPKQKDLCEVCGGNNTCLGCDGRPYITNPESKPVIDDCGICGGINDCYGCDGKKYDTINGEIPARFDICGICGGNNTCIGCDGRLVNLTNGDKPATFDLCGVCAGTNDCVGCDGVVYDLAIETPKQLDRCGVCGGKDECIGCDGVPNSFVEIDGCGVCGGDNSSCGGCEIPPIPFSNKTLDRCGVCGGNNSCIPTVIKREEPTLSLAGVIGIVAGSVIGALVGILAPVLYFSYQSVFGAAGWFLPSGLRTFASVKNNPHYKEKGGPKKNPLANSNKI